MADNSLHGSSPLRILFADDDESVTITFSWMLEALGHEVRVVHDGPSAIEAAQSFKPHVVVLDISLPGMNGYEICQALRADPQFKDILFIAQTGWSDPEYYDRSREAGFDHHFVKPVTIHLIEDVLAMQKLKAA